MGRREAKIIFGGLKLDGELVSLSGNFKGCMDYKRLKNAPPSSLNTFPQPVCGTGTNVFKVMFFGLAPR